MIRRKLTVKYGVTGSLGDYEFVRVDAELSRSLSEEEKYEDIWDKEYEKLKEIVDNKVQEAKDE